MGLNKQIPQLSQKKAEKGKQKMGGKNRKQIARLFKTNHINNHIKCKWSYTKIKLKDSDI